MQRDFLNFAAFLALALVAGYVVKTTLWNDDTFAPKPLPPLMAEGWVNANGPPSGGELKGKLVVIDAWATWCGPCRAQLPDLVRFHEQAGDDVQIIGLTDEGGPDAAKVRAFIGQEQGMSWPVGYGAGPTLDALGNQAYPTYYLFGRDGTLLWQGRPVSALEDKVAKALANGA